MVLSRAIHQLSGLRSAVLLNLKRNFGVSAVVCQKAKDPIQQLFVDKIKEYGLKSKSAGGKLVDANPIVEKQLNDELDKLKRQFGDGTEDLTKFPSFAFKDSSLDPINLDSK